MKDKNSLLVFIVNVALVSLGISLFVAMLGIFDGSLNWDIFSPTIEDFLYAIFGSSLAIAGFSCAAVVVLGAYESIRFFRLLLISQEKIAKDDLAVAKGVSAAKKLVVFCCSFVLVVIIFALVDYNIKSRKFSTFKSLASSQVERFSPQIRDSLVKANMPLRSNVPSKLYENLKSLNNLDFVSRVTIYLIDSEETNAMWGYSAWRDRYDDRDGFARFYTAKPFEELMRSTLDGEPSLTKLNQAKNLEWYSLILDKLGQPKAVIRIDGNPQEDFREYLS